MRSFASNVSSWNKKNNYTKKRKISSIRNIINKHKQHKKLLNLMCKICINNVPKVKRKHTTITKQCRMDLNNNRINIYKFGIRHKIL